MYAIVDIAGQQFKVEKDQKLYVHRLEVEEGKKVSFEKVLLIDTGNKVSVGDPLVKGASVNAKVLEHVKGDKVLVFKKKRRKGYQKLNGHRQYLSYIQIEGISEKAAAKPKKAAAETQAAAEPKADASKPKAAAEPKAAASKPEAATSKPKVAAAKPKAATKPATEKKSTAAEKKSTPAEKKSTTAKKPAASKKPAAAKKPTASKAAPKKEE